MSDRPPGSLQPPEDPADPGPLFRAISLGPSVFPRSSKQWIPSNNPGWVINGMLSLPSWTLIENNLVQDLRSPGQVPLVIRALRNPKTRPSQNLAT